ncbi:hypothetical protein BGZ65_007114 [Modicella reniformis]|uniref:Uncharacterized protein n=1 Tax=Modicella reniformis TaxID=1440133 RepID=A0A9P6MG48_9FUNG|nr:hypothetical protein BGZ65_007114 [Modicella reniformis]
MDLHTTLQSGSYGTHSGDSSPSSPTPNTGDPRLWAGGNYNNMSIREQSRTEYEGYGLESDSRTAYQALQRKHKETELLLERQDRALEQAQDALMNQNETEALRRNVRELHRQISEFNAQITEMTRQIEVNEQVNSTQKSTAAVWKKQKDELEKENTLVKDDLRRKEEELDRIINRLESDEAGKRRIMVEQQENGHLREQLAREIAEKEEIARKLELVRDENLRLAELAELNAGLGSESDTTEGRAYNLTLDGNVNNQGRKTLMSELASADPIFGADLEQTEGYAASQHFDTLSSESKRVLQLLQESSVLKKQLKRSSMFDLSQRFKEGGLESAQIEEIKEPVQNSPSSTANQGEGSNSTAAMIKQKADDVDCALPQGLQILEDKEALLNDKLEAQKQLIDALFKLEESETPLGTSGVVTEGVIRQNADLANLQKTERARRRKPQQSRVLSQQDVIGLLNPGANTQSTAVSKKDSKRMIANATLLSMYTIVGYVLGLVTSVFLVDNAQTGPFNYGRYLSYDAMQDPVANDVNGGPNRFKVFEVLVYWLQNLVWQGDAAQVPT